MRLDSTARRVVPVACELEQLSGIHVSGKARASMFRFPPGLKHPAAAVSSSAPSKHSNHRTLAKSRLEYANNQSLLFDALEVNRHMYVVADIGNIGLHTKIG